VLARCVFAAATLVAACSQHHQGISNGSTQPLGTRGKLGNVGFAYGGLTTSCPLLTCPMMQGAREEITINPELPVDVVIESSNPKAVTVDLANRTFVGAADGGVSGLVGVRVNAVAAGIAELRIKKLVIPPPSSPDASATPASETLLLDSIDLFVD